MDNSGRERVILHFGFLVCSMSAWSSQWPSFSTCRKILRMMARDSQKWSQEKKKGADIRTEFKSLDSAGRRSTLGLPVTWANKRFFSERVSVTFILKCWIQLARSSVCRLVNIGWGKLCKLMKMNGLIVKACGIWRTSRLGAEFRVEC